jgi:hypothetical protein
MMHSALLASTLRILPPLVLPGMLRFLACVVAGIVALALAYLLVRLVWRIRWRSQSVTRYIHLSNQGNLRSDLNLGAYSPSRNLKFTYLLDGAVLPVRKGAGAPVQPAAPLPSVPAPQQTTAAPAAPAAAVQTAATAAAPTPSKAQANGSASTAGAAVATAQETAGKASGIAAILIDIVGTLGGLIPGSAGQALKQKSLEMQRSKSQIKNKALAPALKVKQAKHLKETVGDLGDEVGKKPAAGAAPARVNQGMTQPAAVSAAPTGEAASSHAAQPVQPPLPPPPPQVPEMPCPEYVQLPAITPGSSLRLVVQVSPSNLYYKGESYFWVFTRPQSASDWLPAEALQPQKTVQSITYPGIPLAFHVLSILLSFAVVIGNGVWFFYFVRWLTSSFN